MKQPLVRLRGWWEDLQDSLWLLPSVTVLVAVGLARLLVAVEQWDDWLPDGIAFSGGPDAARALLAELTGATFTVAGVIFSLTVVALQMASSQFTPRLLRTFLKDRGVQWVMSGMIGSGVYYVSVLRFIRSPDQGDEFVPELAVSVALVLAVVSVMLLVYFLHHVTSQLRIDVVMGQIRAQTLEQLELLDRGRGDVPDRECPDPPPDAHVLLARSAGYLQTVDLEALNGTAQQHDVVVRFRPGSGAYVVEGTTLAWAWARDGRAPDVDPEELASDLHDGIHLGPERTESGDLAYGVRQLEDIAARALSTGVNDPTTAVQALAQLSAVLVKMADHPLGADLAHDDDGTVRVAVPRPGFAAHLDLALRQVRRYGAAEPDVLLAILALLTDVAERVADHADRAAAVREQIDRTRDAASFDEPAEQRRLELAVTVARHALEQGQRPATPTEAA